MSVLIEDTKETILEVTCLKKDVDEQKHKFFSPYHEDDAIMKFMVSKIMYSDSTITDPELMTIIGPLFECSMCGAYPSPRLDRSDPDNLKIIAGETACEYVDGFTYDIPIDVPSGELIITDFFNDEKESDCYLSINHKLGQKDYAEWLQKQNIAYAQLSAGGYEIWQNNDTGDIYVGEIYDVDLDEIVVPENHEFLGTLHCGVWSAKITDGDKYKASTNPRSESSIIRVEVPAGKYVLTNYTTLKNHKFNTGKVGLIHAVLKKQTS